MTELESMQSTLKTQIEAARRDAEKEAATEGRAIPADWRHPKEQELADLESVISEAKAYAATH